MQPDEGLFTRQMPGDRFRNQTDPVLQLEKINVNFDGFQALTDLTLNIGVGELRCIIGPNGAGKSTLFNAIAGSFYVDDGFIELDGEDDHVHLLVNYPPKVAVSNLVNSLKGVSSRLLRKERPDIANRYWKNMLWSPSYFASSCGGAPIDVIRRYIEQQQTPH